MISKALAQGPLPKATAETKSAAQPTLAHRANAPKPAANPPSLPSADILVARFLRSLQVLVRSVRLYQRNHPRLLENLESAERELRAAFQQAPTLGIGIERGALMLTTHESSRDGRTIADPRGELRILAEDLAGAGVRSLIFLPRTNLGELALFANAVDATCHAAGRRRGDSEAEGRNWPAWITEHRVVGIQVNAPVERRDDAVLASLLSALLGHEPSPPNAAGKFPESTPDQVRTALRFLANAGPRLEQVQRDSAPEAARVVHAELAGVDPHALAMVVRGVALDPPREGDSPRAYLFRVADAIAVEYARSEYLAGRVRATEVRLLLARLEADQRGPVEEAQSEARVESFWAALPAREKMRVLASPDAWCVPVSVLRRYLETLLTAANNKGAEKSGRQARRTLADFVHCVESEEGKARRAVAAGLVELADLVERLWPNPQMEDLGGRIVAALRRETSPGIAGLLAAVTENLARLALDRGAYSEVERILSELDQAPRNAEHGHITALARRIVAQERWLALVDVALANRALDPVLPRLLRRDPERLLDRLGLLLAAPAGTNALPPMARLVRAAGESVFGTLEAHLSDPRRQRIATAIKLLSAVQPERLAAALPRTLPGWDWNLQDLAVTELARHPSPGLRVHAARAFLATLTEAHLLVVPGMLDHIALAGETSSVPRLIEIAAGEVDRLRDVFIRIRAIEGLGHLRAVSAAALFRNLVRQRAGLAYVEPAGIRSAAEEALALIENRPGSARLRATKEAVAKSSVPFTRPRRYLRVNLSSPLPAKIEGAHAAEARVRTIALGGALLETSGQLAIGDSIRLDIHTGLHRIRSTAIIRSVSPAGCGVEFVHMTQEDREKLRRRISKALS